MSELQRALDALGQQFAFAEAQAAAELQPIAARPAAAPRSPPPADPLAGLRDPLRMLRAKQVAELLGVHIITIYKWVKKERFPPAVQISPTVKAWRATDVARWLEERAAENAEEL